MLHARSLRMTAVVRSEQSAIALSSVSPGAKGLDVKFGRTFDAPENVSLCRARTSRLLRLEEVPMLGMLALMAVTLAGVDASGCARLAGAAAVEQMIAAAEAELYEAEVYADAENDFAAGLDEAGLAGSTLGREELRAIRAEARAGPSPETVRGIVRKRRPGVVS